jgi:diguanylate cyclase (GGDEF)-like protein/PAS domain S-box-containing protein
VRLNLRGKILTIATAVMLFAVGSVIVTSAVLSSREYEAALHSRSLAIGKSLGIQFERLLQLGLGVDDIMGFEEQCQEVINAYPGVDLAFVTSADGRILFHSGNGGSILTGPLAAAATAGVQAVVVQQIDNVLRHNAVIPAATPDGQHVASIVISFPAEFVSARLRELMLTDIGVGLLVLISGLGVLYVALVVVVTRPLGSLINTVSKLRATPQDMSRRATVSSDDELGQLGVAFNGLMDELQHTTVSKSELEKAMEELRRMSDALFEQKEHAEVTLSSIGDAVISVDAGIRVQYLNPVAEQLTGWQLPEALGRPLQEVLRLIDAATGDELSNPFGAAFGEEAASNDADADLIHRDGSAIGIKYTAAPMHGPTGNLSGGVLTLRDVSAERSMAQRLLWEASHDALTGLFNRREFTAQVEAAVDSARRLEQHHVVCFMDLDRFKIVNDTAGHAAGDELLKSLSRILQSHVGQADILARLGGDEFALLLKDCSLKSAQKIAADLLAAVDCFRFDNQGKAFTVGVSIGIAPITGEHSCAGVLSMADTACYQAKEQGRNRVCVYRTGSDDLAAGRRETDWVSRINTALDENRFALFHQTYLPLAPEAEHRDHLEVLVRMLDEDGSLILPGSFVTAAERFNLMPAIDCWVIRHVFARYHRLMEQRGGKPLTCAINVSGASLNECGFLNFVRQQTEEHHIPPNAICFEISESIIVNNLRGAADFAKVCHSLGVLFAVDDFGTGSNSFGYLKNLNVDYIKIDGGFVRNLGEDGIDRVMTEAINRIGRIMGIRTVAKHAENESIINALRETGVTYAQGFAVNPPMPLVAEPNDAHRNDK